MASQEQLRVSEGQKDWSVGMDSSVVPALVPDNGCALAINTTFRGGRPKTRPGNVQVYLQDNPEKLGGLALFTEGKFSNTYLGNYFQGSTMYINKDSSARNYIIVGISGHILKMDTVTGYITPLGVIQANGIESTTNFRWDATRRLYFAQAEKYLIIQNGIDRALIFDGEFLWQTGIGPNSSLGALASVPTGTVMAYGQGRLFVASPDRTTFFAGDLVFGGSTSQVDINTSTISSVAGTSTVINTKSPALFSVQDIITISGHVSTPDINGTWRVLSITNTLTSGQFTIAHNAAGAAAASGNGGFATKANSGSDSDLLRFTEKNYLNEGGSFQVPSEMGKIRGMIFQPIADTATGQGDLMVFAEAGVVTFGVSAPREKWKTTSGFQRITLSKIGSLCERFLLPINNDIFFRSADGIRSYRNAKAEQDGFGQLPISNQMTSIMDFDTESLLESSSAIYFDNRLHFTVGPLVDLKNINLPGGNPIPTRPVVFDGIATFDFNSMGAAGKDKIATWDGLWTGLRVLQLISGYIDGVPKAYAFVQNKTTYQNEFWELYPWALNDFTLTSSGDRIQCALETRAYDFGSPWTQKKLVRGDLWLSDFDGTSLINVYYKPENSSCYEFWHSFSVCAENKTCIPTIVERTPVGVSRTVKSDLINITTTQATSWKLTITDPPQFCYLQLRDTVGSLLGVTEDYDPFSGNPNNSVLKAHPPLSVYTSSRINLATITAAQLQTQLLAMGFGVNTGVSVIQKSANTREWTITLKSPLSNGTIYTEAPDIIPAYNEESTDPCGDFKPLDNRPQFRSQLRLPTPPDVCLPNAGALTKVSHSFQFRIEWQGTLAISKVLWHADKVIENVSGSCL